MTTFTSVSPQREVLHAAMAGLPASLGSVGGVATSATGATDISGERRRYTHHVRYEDVQEDLDLLIDRIIAALEEAEHRVDATTVVSLRLLRSLIWMKLDISAS